MMQFIGFDIETKGEQDGYGLQPYRVRQGKAEITSAALVKANGDVLYAGLNPDLEILAEALRALPKDTILVGWSTLFDVSWLIAHGLEDVVRQLDWADGEVFRRTLENDMSDKSYGLKPTVAKYLPEYAGYESDVAGDFNKVDETLLKYNKFDAQLTAKLAEIFYEEMSPKEVLLAEVICAGIVPFAKAWVEGIRIGTEALDNWEKLTIESLGDAFRKVQAESEKEITAEILGSHSKLKTFILNEGIKVKATNKMELSKFVEYPLVKAILDYKEARTSATRYIRSFREALEYNQDGAIHPSARLWNTYTGRVGYTSKTLKKYQTGAAIHQIPRKKEARNCIVAPEGKLLVECDFAGQESRLMADYSGDETMLKIFSDGLDIHSYLSAQIAEVEYQEFLENTDLIKQYRTLGKIGNLSCQYRTGWRRLIDIARGMFSISIDNPTAQRIQSTYRTTYKRVPEYWDWAIQDAKANGFAESRGGRRVYLYDWSDSNRWAAESTAINFRIQATGADMKFLGIKLVEPMLAANDGMYLMDLHDALFFLVPDTSKGQELALDVQTVLSNLPYEKYFGWKLKVKLPVDLKIGKAWGDLIALKK